MVLSIGTVTLIGFSCYLEEWILKALVGYKFYWTMAFFELVVFAVITYACMSGCGKAKLEPRAAPIALYIAGASTMALYTSLGKIAYKYVNYATGTVLKSVGPGRHCSPRRRTAIRLKTRGFNMRVGDVAGKICKALVIGEVGARDGGVRAVAEAELHDA